MTAQQSQGHRLVIGSVASTPMAMVGTMPMMRFQMNRANGSIKTVMATVTTRLGPNQMRARAYRATQHLTDLDAPMMMAMGFPSLCACIANRRPE